MSIVIIVLIIVLILAAAVICCGGCIKMSGGSGIRETKLRILARFQRLAHQYGIREDDAMEHFNEFLDVLEEEYGNYGLNEDFEWVTQNTFDAMVIAYFPDRALVHFN